jgi:hypothetical protein
VGSLPASGLGWLRGDFANVALSPAGLVLAGDPAFVRDGRAYGIYVSAVQPLDSTFDLARALQPGDPVESGLVELEGRSSLDGLRWSPWAPLPADGGAVSLPPGRFFQFRAELSAAQGEAPLLRGLDVELASTGALPVDASGNNPTVRLFGTREGLVGRKTANGHTIAERDRFVALPSKRVLNPDGKQDYQVRLSYKGKTATAAVWDVGPWNTKDNYWDVQREMFTDLPRFTPQALAAWQSDYNGGRDQFNRWVSFPASIDLADGTFVDDLGMRNSDWVDVAFLWVDAPSPQRVDLPAVTGLKPEPKPPAPAPDGRSWFFPEGSTKGPFETWLLLENPNGEPARASVSYLSTEGIAKRQDVTLNPASRISLYTNQFIPDAEFSLRIDADRPILAERSMYFGGDGHSTTGAPAPDGTWYLAEGSSQPPFDTWLLLQNPGPQAANVVLTFMKDNGENQILNLSIPPTSRRSLHANEIVPQSAFATKLVSDQPIVAERTVYLAKGGGHATLASPVTSKTWYLAEGSALDHVDTWLLIQNPGRSPASVTVTYLRENGQQAERRLTVGATSRAAVNARQDVAGERFGYKVEADQPIVVERAMYFGGAPDGAGTGAHASVGAPEPAKTWFLPEGSTQSPFTEQVLVANPGGAPTHLRVDFVRPDGSSTSREYNLAPLSRLTIDVNAEAPDTPVATHVNADQPVVAERSTYFSTSGGTNSLGIPR